MSWNQPGAWTLPAEFVRDGSHRAQNWGYWESAQWALLCGASSRDISSPLNSLKSSQPQMRIPAGSRGKEHGFLPERILEWVAIPFSKGIFPTPRWDPGLPHCRKILYYWAEIVYIQSRYNHTYRYRLTQTHRYISHTHTYARVLSQYFKNTYYRPLPSLQFSCPVFNFSRDHPFWNRLYWSVFMFNLTFVEVFIQWAFTYPQLFHELHSRDIEFWASMVARG